MEVRKAAADGLATFLFVFLAFRLGSLGILPTWLPAWAVALGIVVLLFATYSGAHVNPGVSLGLAVGGELSFAAVLPYMVAQTAGGIAAVMAYSYVATGDLFAAAGNMLVIPAPGINVWNVMALEAAGTGLLVLFILITTDPDWRRTEKAFAIGLGLGLAVILFGQSTGGSFNPVRAFAPIIIARAESGIFFAFIAYLIGPLLGATIAGLLYRVTKDTR